MFKLSPNRDIVRSNVVVMHTSCHSIEQERSERVKEVKY